MGRKHNEVVIDEAELRRMTHDERRELAHALAELPLAFLMFAAARRLVRVTVQTLMQLSGASGPVPPLWRVPLFADGLEECLPARLRSGADRSRTADVTAGGRSSS